MNNTLVKPVGIDLTVKGIQEDLFGELSSLWAGELQAYGRVQKNKKDGSIVPEWYEGSGEYKEVYYDDRYSGTFFFIDEDSHGSEDEFVFKSKVKVCFMVNLGEILPDAERQDSQAQVHVVETLQRLQDERYEIKGIEKGIDTVFRGLKTSGITYEDIHPMHTFAVVLQVNYYIISHG